MERNLGSAKDVGLCVMFPMAPLMTFLFFSLHAELSRWIGSVAHRALVCLGSIHSSFSTISVCLNQSLSFSLLPHWDVERISDKAGGC